MNYKFLFIKDFKNNHGQIVIPKGTSGIFLLDGVKIHISCDTIIQEQGTGWLTLQFDDVKHCIITRPINEGFQSIGPDSSTVSSGESSLRHAH